MLDFLTKNVDSLYEENIHTGFGLPDLDGQAKGSELAATDFHQSG
jgi:hypothetical protein